MLRQAARVCAKARITLTPRHNRVRSLSSLSAPLPPPSPTAAAAATQLNPQQTINNHAHTASITDHTEDASSIHSPSVSSPLPSSSDVASGESQSLPSSPAAPSASATHATTQPTEAGAEQQQQNQTETAAQTPAEQQTIVEEPVATQPTPPTESIQPTAPEVSAPPAPETPTEAPAATPAAAAPAPETPAITASPSAPAAFNAAAAAAAATGLPPPAVTTHTTIVPASEPTPTKEPCPEEVTIEQQQIASQSPPAGAPLPFPSNHLLWLANGTQSTVGDLFLSHPAADGSAPATPRLVLVVGFVGAYLSLCQTQLPAFSQRLGEFRKRGVDTVYGVSVNDHAVLKSFAEDAGLEKLTLIADQDATFVRSLNLAMDLSAAGMGIRSQRFVMLVREGMVEEAWVETNPGELTISSAESVLKRMPEIKKTQTTTAKVVAAVQAGISAVSDKMDSNKEAKSVANEPTPAAAPIETQVTPDQPASVEPVAPVAADGEVEPALASAPVDPAAPSVAVPPAAEGENPPAPTTEPNTDAPIAQPESATPSTAIDAEPIVVAPVEVSQAAAPPAAADVESPQPADAASAAAAVKAQEAAASVLNDPPPGQA